MVDPESCGIAGKPSLKKDYFNYIFLTLLFPGQP